MRSASWLAVALSVAFASAALGQDAPPPKAKHENVVTPEAKAAIDRYTQLVYRAHHNGVASCNGVLVPIGLSSRARAKFEWEPPYGAEVKLPEDVAKDLSDAGIWTRSVRSGLAMALHPDGVFDLDEFDARIAQRKDGVTTVALTQYENGEEVSSDEFALDREGLVTTRIRQEKGPSSQTYTASYVYAKVGDAYCVSSMVYDAELPAPARYSYTFRYADLSGVRLPVSYDIEFTPKQGAPRKFTFHVADLVVNRKPVALPTPWKHVNEVSPEAKAVMERYRRLVHRPTDEGLASITGTLVNVAGRDESPFTFEFKAGGHLSVAGGAASDATSGRAKMVQVMLGMPLEATLAGVPLADRDEYDARLVDRDGRRVLVVTNFSDGVRGRTDEFTFDSLGLVETAAVDVASAERSVGHTLRLTWHVHAGLGRIRTIDFSVLLGAQGGSMRMQYELTYAPIGGFDLVSSYEFIASGAGGGKSMDRRATFRLENLVVNGMPVEATPAPADKK